MTSYFVIATERLSAAEEKKLAETFAEDVEWWHWLPNFWLVKDPQDKLRVSILRNAIRRINQSKQFLVLAIDPHEWACVTAGDPESRPMLSWLRKMWD